MQYYYLDEENDLTTLHTYQLVLSTTNNPIKHITEQSTKLSDKEVMKELNII